MNIQKLIENHVLIAISTDPRILSLPNEEKVVVINTILKNAKEGFEQALPDFLGKICSNAIEASFAQKTYSDKQAEIDRTYVREKMALDPRANQLSEEAFNAAVIDVANSMRAKINQEYSDLDFEDIADVLFDVCMSEIDQFFERSKQN